MADIREYRSRKNLARLVHGGRAIASAGSFLGWEGRLRRATVMYLDGEMPAETFKERMQLVSEECRPDISLFGYNREDLESHGEVMPPSQLARWRGVALARNRSRQARCHILR